MKQAIPVKEIKQQSLSKDFRSSIENISRLDFQQTLGQNQLDADRIDGRGTSIA
jgi:hypothetical protein